jgi:hypothetical protein
VTHSLFGPGRDDKHRVKETTNDFARLSKTKIIMPGRRRRQNSEDIEDDSGAGTQPQAAEDVSDPETSQRRQPKTEKSYANGKAKKSSKKAAATQDSEEDDEDQDDGSEDEAIDVTKLGNQPLQREAVDKLKGVVEDWKMLESNTRQQWTMIAAIAGAIADATDEEQAKKVCPLWSCINALTKNVVPAYSTAGRYYERAFGPQR